MMTKKKRRLLVISIIISIIVILLITFIILYLKTDMFKSNQTLFLKYLGKNADIINSLQTDTSSEKYDIYASQSEIKVNYSTNIGTTSESTDNSINQLKLKIDGQTDRQSKYDYKKIQLLKQDNPEMTVEYANNDNIYGIHFSDLFDQYITAENSNVKELAKKVGYPDEITANMPDSINFNLENLERIQLTNEEIELLKKVVIDGIITTNWDTFLEATFSDYKTYIGQEQLLFSENISIGEIYKIHGCVTSPESLIVSSNDYANFKKRNAYLAAKLLTIFVEHPVIFLGYSISDPNILELLFSLKDCLAAHNIEKLKDRLIFVEWRAEQNEPIMIDGTLSLSDGKILPIKHIKINSFIPLFDVLANLKQRLPIKILRRFKDAVYEFVKTNEPTNKIYIGDLTNIDENGNDIEFVVGVGVANSIAKQGLLGICVDDVVEDVLFDNKHIPAKEFITDAIPKLLKKRIRIPLYKYYRAEHLLTNDGKLIKKGSAVINNYFKDKSQKSFYPSAKAYAKKENLIRTKYKTLAELIANNDEKHCFYFIPLLEQEKINIDELQQFLMQCFRNGYIKNSYFKQLVCYYDYLKFGLEQ